MGTALLAGLVMVGGMGRVARVSERLVPAMALLYLGSGALVLLVRAEELPRAFSLIFSCALNPEGRPGGRGRLRPVRRPAPRGGPRGVHQ